jgi:hypothetical protein
VSDIGLDSGVAIATSADWLLVVTRAYPAFAVRLPKTWSATRLAPLGTLIAAPVGASRSLRQITRGSKASVFPTRQVDVYVREMVVREAKEPARLCRQSSLGPRRSELTEKVDPRKDAPYRRNRLTSEKTAFCPKGRPGSPLDIR